MKKFDISKIDTQLVSKFAGGFLTIVGIGLLLGDGAYKKRHDTIHLTENDISVSDASDDQVAKKASN